MLTSLDAGSQRAAPARPAASGVGSMLGRYELLERLGVGGMAEVFKARVGGPGGYERSVVIKRILPEFAEDPDWIRMFTAEARILGMLNHANVVQVYDFGEIDGRPFLALEYVDGPSISRVLATLKRTNGRMAPGIAAYVVREVCRALDHVHNLRGPDGRPLRVVHRDVTPSNIALMRSGAVKLLDFGVAKSCHSAVTRSGVVKGKPAYLAPEQVEGRRIDARADVFSAGVVLHEMLCLDHLFVGDPDLVTAQKILEMRIPIPSRLRPEVPPELDAVVLRALERDRARRYQTAGAMARDLDEVVLSSRVRLEEVTAFIEEVERSASGDFRLPAAPYVKTAPSLVPGTAPTMRCGPLVRRAVGRPWIPRRWALCCLWAGIALGMTLLGGLRIREMGHRRPVAAAAAPLPIVVPLPP